MLQRRTLSLSSVFIAWATAQACGSSDSNSDAGESDASGRAASGGGAGASAAGGASGAGAGGAGTDGAGTDGAGTDGAGTDGAGTTGTGGEQGGSSGADAGASDSPSGGTAGTSGGGGEAGSPDVSGGTPQGGSSPGSELPPEIVFTRESSEDVVYRGIWGGGAEAIYAVGDLGTLVRRTGEGTWTLESTNTGAMLTGIWGSGADDIYVSVRSNVILHSKGDGTWEHQPAPSGMTFEDVWGTSADDLYAVAGGSVVRGGSGDWDFDDPEAATRGLSNAYAIWGSSASDLYVAAAYVDTPTVFHSEGDGAWRGQSGTPTVALDDIWGTGPMRIYAAGGSSVYVSNGTGSWQAELTAPDDDAMLTVWALSPGAVYACTQAGRFYRSNGAGIWSEPVAIDSASEVGCYDIWAASTDEVYVAASGGIYRGAP